MSIMPHTNSISDDCNYSAEEAPIQLIHSKQGINIYRQNDHGYKVLMCPEEDAQQPATAAPAVSEEQILKLVREQTVSKYLPHGCNKRRVVDVKGFKGNPSLYFEWVEGITLGEWMREQHGGDVMEKRLRVAMSITNSLHEFHRSGVACNFLTLDHIILKWTSECNNNREDSQFCIASLINLSRAEVFTEVSEQQAAHLIRKDLHDLGLILGALMSGESDVSSSVERRLSDEENSSDTDESNQGGGDQPSVKKRGKQRALGDGLPTYLSSMISALVGDEEDADPSEVYDNALDVLKDLQVAARKHRSSSIPNAKGASLVIPNVFYGRRDELSLLTRSLQTVAVLGNNSIAVISGSGGAGKTTLINQIKKPLQDVNGRFIQLKFDLNTQPDRVIFSAIDSFIGDISDDDEGKELKQQIKDSLGSKIIDFANSANSMPNLTKLIGKSSSKSAVTSEVYTILHQQEQIKCILCSLIASIASRKNPVVLFLDDLHWADKTSLGVIQRIAVSPEITHCFFLACYRDNELELAAPVESLLNEVQSQNVPVIKVPLGRLEIGCTHELVSETLCLPPNLKSVKELVNVVHHKTGGLALYIKNFLHELYEEGLLRFDLSRKWQFSVDQIRQKDVSDDVVEYLMRRMAKLAKSQHLLGLRIASCLGFSFRVTTLQKAMEMNDVDLDKFIQFVESNGFIQRVNESNMHWIHDNVQQAAYKMIPSSKVESIHLLIGGRLLMRTPKEERDEYVFDIVEQMNKGLNLIKTPELKYDGAQLNLRAGQRCMSSLSFHSAAKYFVGGIKILGDKFWSVNYDLTLSLHHAALEALFAIGDYESMGTIAVNILANATSFEDELNAHLYQMRYLTSVGKPEEVVRKCRKLLERLEEPLPAEITKNVIIEEFLGTKAKLKEYTGDDFLALPDMSSKKKLAVMLILTYTTNACIRCQPSLIPLLTFRGMNLTLDHGVSSIAASCISSYGCWLVNQQVSDFEEGFRIGQIAIKMMDRLGDESNKSRVFVNVYGFINMWRQPFQACIDMLEEGYQLGMRQGDINNAYGCLAMRSQMMHCCGFPLEEMIKSHRLYCKNAIMFKEHLYAHGLVGHQQMALSLTGSSEDAYQTYFKRNKKEFEQSYVRDGIQREGYRNGYRLIPFHHKQFLFLTDGPDEEIKEWYELGVQFEKGETQIFFPRRVLSFFIDGMISFNFARKYKNERERWEEVGNSSIAKFKRWKECSEWNFANKFYLLMAEKYFLQDDLVNAIDHYDKAINAAGAHRFLHEEGMANVAAAKCCLHYGKRKEALVYYNNAKECYKSWGATVVLNVVEEKCRNI